MKNCLKRKLIVVMVATTVFVLVVLDDAMNGQVHAEDKEEYRADVSKPFLEST